MTTSKTTAKDTPAKSVKSAPVEPAQAASENAKAAPAEPTKAASENAPAEAQYTVVACCDDTRVTKIVLRDNPAVEDDNDALIVPVGTELRAVEDMGEWTKLTHDLYIMSRYVKTL